jgi:hypothetical protein
MLKRWIEHHYLKQQFQRLERERQEIEQLREDTKHVLGNQLACRIADALLSYGVRNLPDDAEMNDICAMLGNYKQSRRDHLERSLCIDKEYDDALSREIEVEQKRQTLIERFKNRRDAKKAGE